MFIMNLYDAHESQLKPPRNPLHDSHFRHKFDCSVFPEQRSLPYFSTALSLLSALPVGARYHIQRTQQVGKNPSRCNPQNDETRHTRPTRAESVALQAQVNRRVHHQ